jgi:hypothetical protein
MIDARVRFLSAILLLSAGAVPCPAASPFLGFDRTERLRLSQDYPVLEYMVLDDYPMTLLAPSWTQIQKAMADSQGSSDGCKLDRVRYAESLKRQLEDAAAYRQKQFEFSLWLQANGISYLEEALRKGGSMRTVLTPYCTERMEQGGLIHWDETKGIAESFSLELGLPFRPRPFAEQFPVIFHEWGHYVSHRMMEESVGHPVTGDEAELWLNPLDEGFADFVSYAFLGAPAHLEPPMRTALSSSFADRTLVFDGQYPYFKNEDHSAGEPFRDVLIRISMVYGTPRAMKVAHDVFSDILTVQRRLTASPEQAANAAVSAALKRRDISLDALLQ